MSVETLHINIPPDESGTSWSFDITVDVPTVEDLDAWAALPDLHYAEYLFARRFQSWTLRDFEGAPIECTPAPVLMMLHHSKIGPATIEKVMLRTFAGVDHTRHPSWMKELPRPEAANDNPD